MVSRRRHRVGRSLPFAQFEMRFVLLAIAGIVGGVRTERNRVLNKINSSKSASSPPSSSMESRCRRDHRSEPPTQFHVAWLPRRHRHGPRHRVGVADSRALPRLEKLAASVPAIMAAIVPAMISSIRVKPRLILHLLRWCRCHQCPRSLFFVRSVPPVFPVDFEEGLAGSSSSSQ